MSDFNFTLGSRWQSKDAGVAEVVTMDETYTAICPALLQYQTGHRFWVFANGTPSSPQDLLDRLTITGPADDDRQGKPDTDGWITWPGGECPVPGAYVDYKMDGEDHITYNWPADFLRWQHQGNVADIIAYRLAQPSSEASPASTDQGEQAFHDEAMIHAPITLADAIKCRNDRDEHDVSYEKAFLTLAAMRKNYADALLAARKARIERTGEQS